MTHFLKSCRSLRLPAALFFFLLAPAFAADLPSPAPADAWIARAEAQRLYEDPYWHVLLHYRSTPFGLVSRIDDPAFFLAANGRTHPREELAATLAAFFAPAGTNANEHAVCRFPARRQWLQEKLGFADADLPVTACPSFEKVRDYLNPTSVTMIYPAAYMNSPASMFGHTMIVFDSAQKNRLLAQAVTYAARTDESFGPLFAFYGIAGFYKGYYTSLPYYDKVEEYTAVSHRDVWEYELEFSPAEVDRMLRHAWEVQNIYSYYYFFTENCSYNLFYLLDAGRPGLHTTAYYQPFVIPVDTVKYLDRLGLVRRVDYRPAQVTRIRHMAAALPTGQRDTALALARGQRKPDVLPAAGGEPAARRAILDLAAAYTQYLYTEEVLTPAAYRKRFVPLLSARSKLGAADEGAYDVPAPAHPERGHAPARISLGVGAQRGDAFTSIRYRPAYHELLDHDDGFTRGAQIQFLNLDLRRYVERDETELQNVDLVDVVSLSPRDALFQPGSWKFRGGVGQADFAPRSDRLTYRANTGAGYTWATGDRGIAWLMIDGDAQAGSVFAKGYGIGGGPSAGLLQELTKDWKALLRAKLT